MKQKINYVCSHCGGDNIVQFASAYWSIENQAFEFEEPDYNGLEHCSDCDGECSIDIVDYKPSLNAYKTSIRDNWSVVRFCDDTHEPMARGWCWGDGEAYNKYQCDVVESLKSDGGYYGLKLVNDSDGFPRTDADILDAAFHLDFVYYTEWFCEYSDALSDDDVCRSEKDCIRQLLGILLTDEVGMNVAETKHINEALDLDLKTII